VVCHDTLANGALQSIVATTIVVQLPNSDMTLIPALRVLVWTC
jgi:hypothetical protein